MKTLPLAEVKARFSALVSDVESEHDQITVTRNGVPSVVVLSADELMVIVESVHHRGQVYRA